MRASTEVGGIFWQILFSEYIFGGPSLQNYRSCVEVIVWGNAKMIGIVSKLSFLATICRCIPRLWDWDRHRVVGLPFFPSRKSAFLGQSVERSLARGASPTPPKKKMCVTDKLYRVLLVARVDLSYLDDEGYY